MNPQLDDFNKLDPHVSVSSAYSDIEKKKVFSALQNAIDNSKSEIGDKTQREMQKRLEKLLDESARGKIDQHAVIGFSDELKTLLGSKNKDLAKLRKYFETKDEIFVMNLIRDSQRSDILQSGDKKLLNTLDRGDLSKADIAQWGILRQSGNKDHVLANYLKDVGKRTGNDKLVDSLLDEVKYGNRAIETVLDEIRDKLSEAGEDQKDQLDTLNNTVSLLQKHDVKSLYQRIKDRNNEDLYEDRFDELNKHLSNIHDNKNALDHLKGASDATDVGEGAVNAAFDLIGNSRTANKFKDKIAQKFAKSKLGRHLRVGKWKLGKKLGKFGKFGKLAGGALGLIGLAAGTEALTHSDHPESATDKAVDAAGNVLDTGSTVLDLAKGAAPAAEGALATGGTLAAEGAAAAGGVGLLGKLGSGLLKSKGSIAGLVGGVALDAGSDWANKHGQKDLGAGLNVASDTLSGASTGALIGSIIPGVGTVVGGAVGGTLGAGYGLWKNKDQILSHFKHKDKDGKHDGNGNTFITNNYYGAGKVDEAKQKQAATLKAIQGKQNTPASSNKSTDDDPFSKLTSFATNNPIAQGISNVASAVGSAVSGAANAVDTATGGALSFASNYVAEKLGGNSKTVFNDIYNKAKALGDPHPEVTAAQFSLESGFGKHMSGVNNPFGQKAKANEPGSLVTTHEVINGQSVKIQARFKDYPTIDDALKDHITKWTGKHTTGQMNTSQAIAAIQKAGYATDPNYGSKLMGIIAGAGKDSKGDTTTASTTPVSASSPTKVASNSTPSSSGSGSNPGSTGSTATGNPSKSKSSSPARVASASTTINNNVTSRPSGFDANLNRYNG